MIYPSRGNFGSEAGSGVGLGNSVGSTDVGIANGGNGVIVGNEVGDGISVSEGTDCARIGDTVGVMPLATGARVPQETRKTVDKIQKYRCGASLNVIVLHLKLE